MHIHVSMLRTDMSLGATVVKEQISARDIPSREDKVANSIRNRSSFWKQQFIYDNR